MIKRYKRKNNNSMRRASRIYLRDANKGKAQALECFLLLYVNVVNYFIEFFWSSKNFSAALAEKFITSKAVKRFGITARLAQCAAKQAKETVRSQKERKIKTMPVLRRKVATLDSRFVTIAAGCNSVFDLVLAFSSGLPKLSVPLYSTAHLERLLQTGWTMGTSIRLGSDSKGVWVEFILAKDKPALRTEGAIIGVDRGYRKAFVASDGQEVGVELKDLIRKKGKRAKTSYHHLKTELFRALKQFQLAGVKTIVLEDLRYIKHGKRGTFSRHVNRLLSFWSLTRAVEWLKQRCAELGIRLIFVSPYKTSQRCSLCGKIESKNRKGDRFQCVRCGHEDCADHNASKNLEFLGLAGINSFRSLQTS